MLKISASSSGESSTTTSTSVCGLKYVPGRMTRSSSSKRRGGHAGSIPHRAEAGLSRSARAAAARPPSRRPAAPCPRRARRSLRATTSWRTSLAQGRVDRRRGGEARAARPRRRAAPGRARRAAALRASSIWRISASRSAAATRGAGRPAAGLARRATARRARSARRAPVPSVTSHERATTATDEHAEDHVPRRVHPYDCAHVEALSRRTMAPSRPAVPRADGLAWSRRGRSAAVVWSCSSCAGAIAALEATWTIR